MIDRTILHLTLIVEAAQAIRCYIAGYDRAQFLADPLLKDAVAMRLYEIGEAVRRLGPSERAKAPAIEQSRIAAFGRRIVQDYRSIDFVDIWRIVEEELDALEEAARSVLAARAAPSP